MSRKLIKVDQDSTLVVRIAPHFLVWGKAIYRCQEEFEMSVKFAPHVKSFFSRDEDDNIYYKKDYINLSGRELLIELEWGKYFKYFLSGIETSLVLFLLMLMIHNTILKLIMGSILGVIVFITTLWLHNGISMNEISLIKELELEK